MEISPVEGSSPYLPEEEPSHSETSGKVIFWSCTAIACAALAPAIFRKKKRAITPMASPIPSTSSPNALPILDTPSIDSPSDSSSDSYDSLPCSETDKAHVRFTVETIHSWLNQSNAFRPNPFKLPFQAGKLLTLKKHIDPLHPFKFLESIFSEKDLRPKIKAISKSICWHPKFMDLGFMAGINEGMNREAKQNNLERYLPRFAERLKVDPEPLKPWIRDGQWERFALHLIEKIC